MEIPFLRACRRAAPAFLAALLLTAASALPVSPQEPEDVPGPDAAPAPNAWQLVFARTIVGGAGDASGAEGAPTREAESIVLLAGDRMGVLDTERGERILDFARRRIHVLDRDRGAHLILSLYAEVAARERRLAAQDAIRARSALPTDEAGTPIPSPAESESYFGMRGVEPARPEIRQREEDGVTIFAVDGEDTAWFRPSEESVPEALRPALARFLAWDVRLHPALRERILATGRAPVFLRLRYPSPEGPLAETLQLRYSGATAIDWSKPFEGLQPATLDDAPSSVTAHRIRAGQLDSPVALETYVADARRRLAAGHPLDAALALLAATSAHGRDDPEVTRALDEAQDADVRALRAAIALLADDPEAALARIDGLSATDLEYAHVLDLLRAAAYDALDRRELALERYDRAVQVDPYLTGAWCDLGRLHFRAERMPLAWLAWDAARALRPDHPAVAPIDALETSLRERFPAFF